MADIARSEPYRKLFRSIGYSVGGEKLLERALELTEFYAVERRLTRLDWRSLVAKFGRKLNEDIRKKDASDHMADMYSSLGLLNQINAELFPGPALEALAIIRNHQSVSSESDLRTAARVILLSQIIEADGDIFLNCLAGNFVTRDVKTRLESCIRIKRDAILDTYQSPDIRRKIYSYISIKTFSSGSRVERKSPFAIRTQPLNTVRARPLDGKLETDVVIADDYMKKAPALRKAWAIELGLFDSGAGTQRTERLLREVQELGLMQQEQIICVWALEQESLQLGIDPETIGSPILSHWDLVNLASSAFLCENGSTSDEPVGDDEAYSLLSEFLSLYRQASIARGSIRHQLPIYIANLAMAGISVLKGKSLLDMPSFLASEGKRLDRRINVANLRGTDGAIAIKSIVRKGRK